MFRKLILFLMLAAPMLRAQYVYVTNFFGSGFGGSTITGYRLNLLDTLQPTGTLTAGGGTPMDVAVDPLNRFVFIVRLDGYVTAYRINAGGSLSTIASYPLFSPEPDLWAGQSLAVDPSGRFLYVAAHSVPHGTGNVTAFAISNSGTLTLISDWLFDSDVMNTVAVDPQGRYVYVAGTTDSFPGPPHGLITTFRIGSNGVLTQIDSKTTPDYSSITGMAVDPLGRFVFAAIATPEIGNCCQASLQPYAVSSRGLQAIGLGTNVGEAGPGVFIGSDNERHMLAVDPSGKFVYFSAEDPNADPFDPAGYKLETLTVDSNGVLTQTSSVAGVSADLLGVDPTGSFVFTLINNVSGFGVIRTYAADKTGILKFIAAPTAGVSPNGIATTSCTAPLPGTQYSPLVNLKAFTTPFYTSVNVGQLSQPVTFSGLSASVVQTAKYAAGCPAVTYNVHVGLYATAFVKEINGFVQMVGSGTSNGTTMLGGRFSLPLTLRIVPPSPIIPPNPISVQSFVEIDANGAPTSVTTPPSDLVSWWKAEGNGADATGNNPGTLSGVLFTPGRVGQAFDFSFVSDILPVNDVQVASSPSLKPQNVTVMAWVKHAGYPGHDQYILSQGAKGCFAGSYALYSGSNNLSFYISDGGNFYESPDAGQTVWDGNWHFVAGTYDGSAVRLYVDGIEAGTGTSIATSINYANMDNDNFYIGAYRGSCDLGFPGSVDEVRVFKRALSAAEIQSIYQATQ